MKLLHTAYVPEGEGPFPTIVAIHGFGANAMDLLGLAPILHGGEALVLCPQGPLGLADPQSRMLIGFAWFQITSGRPPDPLEFARATGMLEEWLDEAAKTYPIDKGHVVLVGFSQGGVLAYDLFLRQPDRFAGLVALSSWLPPEVAERATSGEALKGRPVLVMHGSADPMIPVERAHESRDRLLPLGVNVTYREFDMGHEIAPEALRALLEWFDEKPFAMVKPSLILPGR
jgi:phospholipase/carboxylesterase